MESESKRDNSTFLDLSRDGKKFILYLPEKMSADFLLKIAHESILFRRFFRFLVEGYLKDDKRITAFLDEAIKSHRSKALTKAIEKERKQVEIVEKQFNLNPNEIEDIYDIIEEEFDI